MMGRTEKMKIVESGYKMDLHIHSIYSKLKDAGKVSFNTLDNLEMLISKLNENLVQLCAITDHDCFNYEIYSKLRLEEGQGSIVKVFPGIEFSVEFQGDEGESIIHVIAIFDDANNDKIIDIQDKLLNEKGQVDYDRNQAFSEVKFIEILRAIDLDTILIAHQKNSLGSKNTRKRDVNTVGEHRFEEFVYTDYFEAFEFKNRRNEIFNKAYLYKNKLNKDIRFVTGSDCHDWRHYPKETENDSTDSVFTYVKCLPTFRGLVMAMTDYRRIKTVNSFFNISSTYISSIDTCIDTKNLTVPLSRGINVIIGDNSIGKSLLLHKMTDYYKKNTNNLKAALVKGYDKYLKQNKISLNTCISENQIFGFDMQGEVRAKFEQDTIKFDEFLKNYYPPAVNSEEYRIIIERELGKIFAFLSTKFDIEKRKDNLGQFYISNMDGITSESLTFVGKVTRDNKKVAGYEELKGKLASISETLKTLRDHPLLELKDKKELEAIIELLKIQITKYNGKKNEALSESLKIGIFQDVIKDFKQSYATSVADEQRVISTYFEDVRRAVDAIVELKQKVGECSKPKVDIESKEIKAITNRVFKYEFVSRLNIENISNEYICEILEKLLKKDCTIAIEEMTQANLAESILSFRGETNQALSVLKKLATERVNEDLKAKFVIIKEGADKTQELSAGFNAQIYFDLLSYESERKGIYIIDQPEDNISQKAISEYLLDRFKVMGENRQVIIVTHNPQFIVNLDVDNVVYIGRENNQFIVWSGALEYKDSEYDMLELISSHIEGGLDTLKRRWKRYEKGSQFSE